MRYGCLLSLDLLSVCAIGVSLLALVLTLYFQSWRDGKLIFSRPTFIGATQYLGGVANDVLIIPVSVTNTGVHTKTLRFGLILTNNGKLYHQQLDLDSIPLPEPTEPFSLKEHRFAPTPLTLMPISSAVKIIGFTQLDYLKDIDSEPIFDLFYNREDEWKFALKLTWKTFKDQKASYIANPTGLTTTTMGFNISNETPTYDFKSILEGRPT